MTVAPDLERSFEVTGPYSLEQTLRLHRFGPMDPTMRVSAQEVWRAARLRDGPVTMQAVRSAPERIDVKVWGPGAEAMLASAPLQLGLLDTDREIPTENPGLAKLSRRFGGLRVPKMPDPLLFMVKTILEQRVRWKDAARSWRKLLARFGEDAPGPHPELRILPPGRFLAKIPSYEMAAMGVEQKRARVIRAVCSSYRRIDELVDMPIEDAMQRMRAFSGVGPWTAGMVAGYALGHADAAPTGDLDLPHVVTWALAGERPGSDERMLELLEPYRPHRWRVIRMLMSSGVFPPRTGPGRKLGPTPGRDGF